MKTSHTISYFFGYHDGVVGTTLRDLNQTFSARGVAIGDTLENLTSGQSGNIDSVAETELTAGTLAWRPGDLYEITLTTAWTVKNTDMISYDSECRLCGWSYPREQLNDRGLCSTCEDED